MKRVLILVWLCAITMSVYAQKGNKRDVMLIMAVLDEQAAAWNTGDIATYMQGYWHDDSLLFIGSKGPVYGYKPTLERYQKSYPDKQAMGELRFSELTFKKLSNEYYFVTGKWSLQRDKDNPNGYFTLLFRKIEDAWLIVADHSS